MPRKIKKTTYEEIVGLKLTLHPNATQKGQLAQAFGNARFVWNEILGGFNDGRENNPDLRFPFDGKVLNAILTLMKKEYPFLYKSDSTSLQASIEHLNRAMQDAVFNHKGFPKFKSRKFYQQTITIKNNKATSIKKIDGHKVGQVFRPSTIRVLDKHHIWLPKLGAIYTGKTGQLYEVLKAGRILSVTITYRQDCDRYWISIQHIATKGLRSHFLRNTKKTGKSVGIDLGLSDEWIVTSDGKYRIQVPDTTAVESQKRQYQRKMDKQLNQVKQFVAEFNKDHKETEIDKYSYQNWQKTRKILSKLNMKLSNIRHDQIQKITTELVQNYDVIVVENLRVKNMMKNHKLARAIANASWGEFVRVLEYKCKRYGKKLIKVAPQYTSRVCANCGQRNPEFDHLKTNKWLAIRDWTCPYCHEHHDRDVNAAKNILAWGLATLSKKNQTNLVSN